MNEKSTLLSEHYGLEVSVETPGTVHLLVSGDVDLETAPLLLDSILSAGVAHGPGARVVVDVQRVTFIDSSGLAALVEAHHRITALEQELCLANPTERVQRLITLTSLDRILAIESPAGEKSQAS
jgi:anti-sigma B factor antagonist